MVNKVLNGLLVTKIINKGIRPLCISKYKRYSDKNRCMYFMIKDEKIFDKYMKIWEIKVSNIIS